MWNSSGGILLRVRPKASRNKPAPRVGVVSIPPGVLEPLPFCTAGNVLSFCEGPYRRDLDGGIGAPDEALGKESVGPFEDIWAVAARTRA